MPTPAPAHNEPDLSYRDLTDAEVFDAIKDVDETATLPVDEVRRRLLSGLAGRKDSDA